MSGLFLDEPRRLPGVLITLDGPGGVGKSTATRLVVETLQAAGVPVHATTQPSRAPLGELARLPWCCKVSTGCPPRWCGSSTTASTGPTWP
ncbi:MAG: hypothetical protein ACRDRQ_05990 [Pseudonocardiaceae bacterium]